MYSFFTSGYSPKSRALLFLFLVFNPHTRTLAQSGKQPNIILIYADDLGYNETGVYGQTKIKTPFIDRMAAEGMRFTQFYSGSPVCAPARCILLTGLHSGRSYIRGNYELGGFDDFNEGGQMPLPEGTRTIAHFLRERGYATGAVGKWGLGVYGTTGSPDKMGFDYFYGYLDQKQAHNHYPTHLWESGKWDSLQNPPLDVHQRLGADISEPDSFKRYTGAEYAEQRMIEKTRSFITQHRKSPFFLYLPYTLPHLSLQVPDDKIKKYRGSFKEEQYHGEKGYASTLYPRSAYAAMVSYLDSMVGEVFKSLKENGLFENTLVIFSSDNGASFNTGGFDPDFFESNRPLRGGKQDLFEGGIRVPFLAWWPGKIKAGSVSAEISWQADLLVTLTSLTGRDTPESDGVSLLPLFSGNKITTRPYLYFEFPEKGGQIAIRMGKWKGVKLNLRSDPKSTWLLFDLEKDISESTNLATNHPDILKQFDLIVKKEHRHPHIREWEIVDPKF